jgi:hypothetical protein
MTAKIGIVENEEAIVARQGHDRHVFEAADVDATIENAVLSKEEQRKKKKKVLTQNNIWPWFPAGLDAKSDRAGWLPAVSYCSACSALQVNSGSG